MSQVLRPPNPFAADAAWQWPALDQVFFLPGDWAVYALATYAPALSSTLGVGPADYGGVYAGVLAFWFWLVVSLAAIMAAAAARRLDRALTRTLATGYGDVLYRIRLARTRAAYRRRTGRRIEPTVGHEPR